MTEKRVPIGHLEVDHKGGNGPARQSLEPVYGGYANARGDVNLFAEHCTYRVNFKNHTLSQRPSLNAGAQAHYDAVDAGERFCYAKIEFLRLSDERIAEICASGSFRIVS